MSTILKFLSVIIVVLIGMLFFVRSQTPQPRNAVAQAPRVISDPVEAMTASHLAHAQMDQARSQMDRARSQMDLHRAEMERVARAQHVHIIHRQGSSVSWVGVIFPLALLGLLAAVLVLAVRRARLPSPRRHASAPLAETEARQIEALLRLEDRLEQRLANLEWILAAHHPATLDDLQNAPKF